MKIFKYISYAAALALLVTGGAVFTSCQEDLDVEQNTTGLKLSPQLFGMDKAATRAVDEDQITQLVGSLRENYMGKKLEVYVVGTDNDNQDFFNKYIFTESEQLTSKYYLMEQNWRQVSTGNQQYVVGDHYRLYALVNRNSTDEINSLADLKNATVGVVDDTHGIHRWYDAAKTTAPWPDSDNGRDGWELDKTFAMDGHVDFEFTATEKDKQLDVYMKRACAKIVLDLKIDPEFLKKIKEPVSEGSEDFEIYTSTPWVRPVNFNYHAYAADGLTDRAALAPQWYNANLYVIDERGSQVTAAAEVDAPVRQYQLNTYCYPFSWEGYEIEHTPMLVVSIGMTKSNNVYYYSIPVTQKSVKELKRNHVYHIDATITGFGALKVEDVTENVVKLHYDVMDWTVLTSEISLVDVEGDMDFLMVDPKEQSMYGENADDAIVTFYAPDNDLVRYDGVDVYYYDANNNKVTSSSYLPSGNYSITKVGNTYKVSSSVLENHAVKIIKFRVYFDANNNRHYDTGEKYEWVIVKHFPLDFFQNDQGLWSSRTTSDWWTPPTTANWWTSTTVGGSGIGRDQSVTEGSYWSGYTTYTGIFSAKYFYTTGGYIRSATNTEYATTSQGHGWQNNTSLTNRNKYIIQITETSNNYVLGRPVNNNDHVVSPAFMIASQLGATVSRHPERPGSGTNSYSNRATEARNHCTTYKEVDQNGTAWTGWRLPTREEVGVILRYQNAGYDTMEPVMTGSYYWTLEGAAVATGKNEQTDQWDSNWATLYSNTANDYINRANDNRFYSYDLDGYLYIHNTYIRCIRDLSPSEVNEINAKIGHEND